MPYLGQMLVKPSWLSSFFADGGLMGTVIVGDGKTSTHVHKP